ncbi:MFS transporter [Alicyclobacillus hesperidum]|uniref:MFS transporter n=1 Tax=Alicyclobacillus hesperidum TaxID=89784 RepID=A0A1H2UDM6_9BACL|nr:MFS transporter [Alicyclobacillus hesperidum]GLV14186.1 MFS transporter [Alicyclobacillus hesperidum]SDW54216.1 MFS transporter, YNFM family, putative membrane transport protein [Alicyclobacillus hesperidum]
MNDGTPTQTAAETYLERGTTIYRRVSLAFLAAGIVTFANLYCVQPLFPIFSARFQLTPAISSLSLSVTTFILSVSLPMAAWISDIWGRKPVMVTSLVTSSALGIIAAVCPSFTALLVVRALQGLTLAGLPAVAMAYLSEEVAPRGLGYAMGLYISGNSIGGLLGRICISFLADHFSWRIGILVFGTVSLFLSLYFWRSLPKSRHFTPQTTSPSSALQAFREALRDRGLIYLYLIGALLMGGFVCLYNYIGFRLLAPPYRLSQSLVGMLFIVYIAGTFSSSWMGRLADRIGRKRVLLANVLLMGGGAVITLLPHLFWIVIGMTVFTFGFFGGHSTASSWVGRRAIHAHAQASSLYLLFYYVGSSVGGSLGGFFWSSGGWPGTVGMIVIANLCAVILSIALTRIPPVAYTSRQS